MSLFLSFIFIASMPFVSCRGSAVIPEVNPEDTESYASTSGMNGEPGGGEEPAPEQQDRGGAEEEGGPFIVKGACTYNRFPGSAEITALEFIGNGQVEIVFHFSPDDPAAPETYRFSHVPDTDRKKIFYHDEATWDAWAREKGIVPPAAIACVRAEITAGTCTPVVFLFPDIDQ